MVQNNRKEVFKQFLAILGPFGHPQIEPKKVDKDLQVAGCLTQCLSLEISPYPNHYPHSFRINYPKQPENSFLFCYWSFSGCLGTPKSGWDVGMARCLSMKIPWL
jgi:hypothetical protein